jgi:hypothetical protein
MINYLDISLVVSTAGGVVIVTGNRYIREKRLDWSYWPLDGQQGPSRTQGSEETYGLLNMTWSEFAYTPLIQELAKL